jgi:RNA polymerase sigma factor (sigma-70 family)
MNVLLVDDHASVRQALAFVFEREPDCTVVAQAGSLEEARNLLNNVDVAVVDLDLPGSDGFAMVRELCSANPRSTILGLTASAERKWVALAVEAGAAGVLHKSVRVSDIIQAMRRLNAGDQLFSPAETVELLRLASRQREEDREAQLALDRLTPRERAVLQQLAEGLNDKEIAQRLHISSGTVHSHMVSILRKLAVESRLQALVFAVRHGAVTIA